MAWLDLFLPVVHVEPLEGAIFHFWVNLFLAPNVWKEKNVRMQIGSTQLHQPHVLLHRKWLTYPLHNGSSWRDSNPWPSDPVNLCLHCTIITAWPPSGTYGWTLGDLAAVADKPLGWSTKLSLCLHSFTYNPALLGPPVIIICLSYILRDIYSLLKHQLYRDPIIVNL